MAKRTGITDHTLAVVQAGTTIEAQFNDEILVTDLDDFGRKFIYVNDTVTADDGAFTLEETVQAGVAGRWRAKEAVSSLVGGNVNVPFTALLDNTEESISVALTGIVVGEAYVIGIVSGLPADTTLELEENHGANTLNFTFENNSGATLTAGTIVVNVYRA